MTNLSGDNAPLIIKTSLLRCCADHMTLQMKYRKHDYTTAAAVPKGQFEVPLLMYITRQATVYLHDNEGILTTRTLFAKVIGQ